MSVLKRWAIPAAFGPIIVVLLGGCNPEVVNGGKFKEVIVDRQVFRMPEMYLVKGAIPWLPESQHEGLSFVINPESKPEKQKIVVINSFQTTCSSKTFPTSNMLDSACSSLIRKNNTEITGAFSPERFYPHDSITFQ